jgi:soluble lytic murein transglycosylase-like protein
MVAGRAPTTDMKHMVTRRHAGDRAIVSWSKRALGGGVLARRALRRRLLLCASAATFALALAAPRGALEGDRVVGAAEAELPSCRRGLACPDPGPEGWAARIETLLEERAPGLEEPVRRRVARAVVEESRAAGIDPLLTAAIIDVESGFDARARSWAGARGLMQLQPSTMEREAARSGLAAGDPHDPVVNVRVGIRYFRRLVQTFGRIDRALMAYNAGPNRIGAFLQGGRIPAQYRVYPARVFAEQRRLRRLFGEEAPTAVAVASLQAVR